MRELNEGGHKGRPYRTLAVGRPYGILAVSYVAVLVAAAACTDDLQSTCFESNATGYATHAPGDTSITFRWTSAFVPVRFYAEPTGELQANVDAGLQLWANAFRCSELTMVRIADSTQADVIIRNPSQFPPAAAASFHADSVGACTGRTDVEGITVDDELIRPMRIYVVPLSLDSVAVASCYHFVTAHEIGHTLGLFSHSSTAGDLMNAVPRRTLLSGNDRLTIQLLYHRPSVNIVPEPR